MKSLERLFGGDEYEFLQSKFSFCESNFHAGFSPHRTKRRKNKISKFNFSLFSSFSSSVRIKFLTEYRTI